MPAFVAKAAAEALVLPVEAQMTALAPDSTAFKLKEQLQFGKAKLSRQIFSFHQGGTTLAKTDDRSGIGDWQVIAVFFYERLFSTHGWLLV
jgi:hypothetical protein